MGMVKTVQYLVDYHHKHIIKEYAIELLDTLLSYKDKSGMFHNIVNDESSFLGADNKNLEPFVTKSSASI